MTLGSTGVMVVMMAVMCFVAGLPLKRVAYYWRNSCNWPSFSN